MGAICNKFAGSKSSRSTSKKLSQNKKQPVQISNLQNSQTSKIVENQKLAIQNEQIKQTSVSSKKSIKTNDQGASTINHQSLEPLLSQEKRTHSMKQKEEDKTDDNKELEINECVINHKKRFTSDYCYLTTSKEIRAYQILVQHNRSGLVRAVKIFKKKEINNSLKELELLSRLIILKDHPNIIKIFDIYQDQKLFYVITEVCDGGELLDLIQSHKQLSESTFAEIMYQLLSALNYLHSNGIIHRNINPEYIFFLTKDTQNKPIIKLSHFSNAEQNYISNTEKIHGNVFILYKIFALKLNYACPQMVKKQKVDTKCDIWSCGILLYFMLSGTFPFSGKDPQSILMNISRGIFNFDGHEWENVSLEAKILINQMLAFKSEKRPNAHEILKDKWFKIKNKVSKPLSKTVLKNIEQFQKSHKLQKAILSYIINLFQTNDEKEKLFKTFQQLDVNHNGKLSKEEVMNGYKLLYGQDKFQQGINEIFDKIDVNHNGEIDYSEFIIASIDRVQLLTDEKLLKAFQMIDEDGSGKISKSEIKKLFGNAEVSSEKFQKTLQKIDINGDGYITLSEFKFLMKQMLNNQIEKQDN